MIRNNLFGGNSQSFQQQQFGGQGYSQRNQRQPQEGTSQNQFTGYSPNMLPTQVNSFSAAPTGLPSYQRVDTFGSSSGAGSLRKSPQFGAVSASEGPQKNSFKGSQDFQGQDHLALRSQLQSGQVTFRGDGGAPYTSQSLYMMG